MSQFESNAEIEDFQLVRMSATKMWEMEDTGTIFLFITNVHYFYNKYLSLSPYMKLISKFIKLTCTSNALNNFVLSEFSSI